MIVGASSDKDAMVKIMRHLEDGYMLTHVNLCRAGCPVPVHLHFTPKRKVGGHRTTGGGSDTSPREQTP